jgi:RNA polymerase sigma factor (TIGR02999 family)
MSTHCWRGATLSQRSLSGVRFTFPKTRISANSGLMELGSRTLQSVPAEVAMVAAGRRYRPFARLEPGDEDAKSALMTAVYGELRRIAARRLRDERPGHSLAATALVHETYLKLVNQTRVQWQNRAQFFALASQLMRRVLVDHARSRQASKRGGGRTAVLVDDSGLRARTAVATHGPSSVDILALDVALDRLKEVEPRHSTLVELRFFGGLSVEETAQALNVSRATVTRDWAFARAWLYRELRSAGQ